MLFLLVQRKKREDRIDVETKTIYFISITTSLKRGIYNNVILQ